MHKNNQLSVFNLALIHDFNLTVMSFHQKKEIACCPSLSVLYSFVSLGSLWSLLPLERSMVVFFKVFVTAFTDLTYFAEAKIVFL